MLMWHWDYSLHSKKYNLFMMGVAITQGNQQRIITQLHCDIENKIKTASCVYMTKDLELYTNTYQTTFFTFFFNFKTFTMIIC